MSYYSEKLKQVLADPLQKKAYDSPDSTVVIAGPGSGKTTILTLKIMKLLNTQIKEPHGLACLTFSREAAREFEDRLKLLGYEKRRNVFLGTVHSFCISEILGNFAYLYDYGIKLPIKILPSKLDKKIYESVLKDLGIKKFNKTEVDKERSLHITGMSGIQVESNETAYRIAKEYEKRVLESGYIDYESIILYSTRMLQEQEYVRKCISAKYSWLVIDEYQDLGRPLHEMVMSLFTQTEIKIFAVGDPDQSIYGFSGAIPDYLMELYKRKDTISVKLTNNYRSNQDIIDGSETVLQIPRHYHAMTREGEKAVYRFVTCQNGLEEQYQFFIEKIVPACQRQKIPLEEIAVLLGKNEECNSLALMCMERNIPYYISKHNFERTDFVKWLEACSVWVNDKSKISFDEIYVYWQNIIIMHRQEKFLSETDCLNMKKIFFNILSKSIDEKDNLKKWLFYMFSNLKVGTLLQNSEVLPDELDNLRKLYSEVSDKKYKDYTTKQFSHIGKPLKQITITTRHSSKGLEFEVVVMMGMEEKHFPGWYVDKNPKALYEENRICFVCVSRAKRVCIFMHSNYYNEYDYRYGSTCLKRYYSSRYIKKLKKKFE